MSHKEWLSALGINENKMIIFYRNNSGLYLFDKHSGVKGSKHILCSVFQSAIATFILTTSVYLVYIFREAEPLADLDSRPWFRFRVILCVSFWNQQVPQNIFLVVCKNHKMACLLKVSVGITFAKTRYPNQAIPKSRGREEYFVHCEAVRRGSHVFLLQSSKTNHSVYPTPEKQSKTRISALGLHKIIHFW